MMRLTLAAAAVAAAFAQSGGPNLALNTCTQTQPGSFYQVFTLGTGNTPNMFMPNGPHANYCWDIENFDLGDNATVYTWQCGDGSKQNEFWTVTANQIQSQQSSQKCLGAYPGYPVAAGTPITTMDCDATNPAQSLHYDSSTGRVTHTPSGLCVDANVAMSWCESPLHANWTICDPTAAIDDRAADIVSRLSLDDKFQALGTSTPVLPSVQLPAYNWWSEATHGISHVQYSNELPYASNTAMPITTSCSFNRSLWHATGNQIGREAKAFNNLGQAYSTFWAPVINLARDTRWGRISECAGEDPFLSGQYAINFVKGFEHAPEDPYTLQASACCKHFVANELESWNGTDRHHFDAMVTQQDLVDTYLPPFEMCVMEGQVSGIMCSYNAVNGVPSCANDWLLSTVLRQEWQFDGYVTSDCDADDDVYSSHHYEATPELVVRDVLRAGTDVDCGGFVTANAANALANGTIVEADIDTVLKRLFRMRIRLGHFDPPGPLSTIGPDQVCNPYALELARDGARQGTVLLKNTGNTLPLNAASFASAVVIGPNTNLSQSIAQYYAGTPCNNTYWTLLNSIQQFIPNTVSVAGLPNVLSNDTSGFAAAVSAAQSASLVVLALGTDRSVETEGHDRTSIDLPYGQQQLVAAITAAVGGKKPIVAVTMSGGTVDVSSLLSNPSVGGLLHAGWPSVQVLGVGDLIFGQAVPAARLSQSIYFANYTSLVSLEDMGMRPGPSAYPPGTNPGRTHRFYPGPLVLPFGYGLSYTTWQYTPVDAPAALDMAPIRAAVDAANAVGAVATPAVLKASAVDYYINVTNTGTVDADDVVLGFLTPPGAGQNGVPLQQLFGFERVFVPAGQTVTVYIGAQGVGFTQVDDDGKRYALPGEYTIRFGLRQTVEAGMGFAEVKLTAA